MERANLERNESSIGKPCKEARTSDNKTVLSVHLSGFRGDRHNDCVDVDPTARVASNEIALGHCQCVPRATIPCVITLDRFVPVSELAITRHGESAVIASSRRAEEMLRSVGLGVRAHHVLLRRRTQGRCSTDRHCAARWCSPSYCREASTLEMVVRREAVDTDVRKKAKEAERSQHTSLSRGWGQAGRRAPSYFANWPTKRSFVRRWVTEEGGKGDRALIRGGIGN